MTQNKLQLNKITTTTTTTTKVEALLTDLHISRNLPLSIVIAQNENQFS